MVVVVIVVAIVVVVVVIVVVMVEIARVFAVVGVQGFGPHPRGGGGVLGVQWIEPDVASPFQ